MENMVSIWFGNFETEEDSDDIHILLEGCSYDILVIPALAQIKGQVDYIATVPYQKE